MKTLVTFSVVFRKMGKQSRQLWSGCLDWLP